jgi:hypothetical protein
VSERPPQLEGPHRPPSDPLAPHAPLPASVAPADAIILTGADLTVAEVEAVARHGATAALDIHARVRMSEARAVV